MFLSKQKVRTGIDKLTKKETLLLKKKKEIVIREKVRENFNISVRYI